MLTAQDRELYDKLIKPESIIIENGEVITWITTLDAPSRRALSRMVRERNWRKDTGCGTDCTGRVFAASCRLLIAFKAGATWRGIVLCSEYFDV